MKSLGLEPVPRSPRHDLARPEVKLPGTVGHRRTVVVDVADEAAIAVALDLRPVAMDSPVVDGLEERLELVLLLEAELGLGAGGEGGERESAFVAGLEVEVRREEVGGAEAEVGPALAAAVDRRRH